MVSFTQIVGFEVIATVIMKNVVLWGLTPCSSVKDPGFTDISDIFSVKE
jgi:hypothetical protein